MGNQTNQRDLSESSQVKYVWMEKKSMEGKKSNANFGCHVIFSLYVWKMVMNTSVCMNGCMAREKGNEKYVKIMRNHHRI